MIHFSLTVSKLALFEHLTEALAESQVTLVLCTFNKLFKLIRARLLLLLLRLLLVHGLSLVRLLKKKQKAGDVIFHMSDTTAGSTHNW